MKNDYQDLLIQNLSVVIGSALIGLGARIAMLEKGADQFTANIIFLIVVLLGVVLYSTLVLLGVSLFELFKRLKSKNKLKNSVVQTEIADDKSAPSKTINPRINENLEITFEKVVENNVAHKIQNERKIQRDQENCKSR